MMLNCSEQNDDAARFRQSGVAACLIKPVRRAELRSALLAALGQPSGQTELGEESLRKAAEACTGTHLQPLRILLAEDNVVNQRVARVLLEKVGHIVTVCGNGLEAIRLMDEQVFDLVLMDVQMPEMDGFEATAALRAGERATGRHLSVIAMTAHAMKGDEERCLEAGMDAYVAKPIRPDVLFAVIETVRAGSSKRNGEVPAPR